MNMIRTVSVSNYRTGQALRERHVQTAVGTEVRSLGEGEDIPGRMAFDLGIKR